jgi:hypothetical protein
MDRKSGVKINSRKLVAFFTLILFMLQYLPLMTFGATGTATIIKGGNTPTAPTNVKASLHISGSTKYVTISWSPSKETEKGIAQYRVYRNGTLLGSTVNCSYTDRTVKDQQKYQYKVVGIGNNGRESKPGVSNTVDLVQKQAVISAKTGKQTGLQDFKTPLTYQPVKNVKTGSISYALKPVTATKTKSTGLPNSNIKLASGLNNSNIKLASGLNNSNIKLASGLNLGGGKLNLSSGANLSAGKSLNSSKKLIPSSSTNISSGKNLLGGVNLAASLGSLTSGNLSNINSNLSGSSSLLSAPGMNISQPIVWQSALH